MALPTMTPKQIATSPTLVGRFLLDSGSQKVQRECENRLISHLRNLLSIDGLPENSSAIDRAPGARSKSDEFSEVRMAVQKLFTYKCLKPLKTHAAPFGIRAPVDL